MFRCRRPLSALLLALAICVGGRATAEVAGTPLQLEVFRNGEDTGLVAAFIQRPDGGFSAAAGELRAIGLVAPQTDDPVALDTLTGVTARYDAPRQRIFIDAAPQAIAPLRISLRDEHKAPPVSRDSGAVLNYSLSARSRGDGGGRFSSDGVGGAFEARAFGRFGMVSSGFTAEAGSGPARAVRLDTTWTWARPDRATAWRAGDLISGGFAWTRPIRMGGAQWRRDFAVRPDLVTMPTPTLSASAAAASSLEVLMGTSVVLSRNMSAGPVQVSDLPIVQGQGEARLILRDATGAEQQVVAAYFASPELLKPGLLDFSVEAGFARRNFGLRSSDYDDRPVASASVRMGLTQTATLQAHVEAGAGLVNGGAGVVTTLGDRAVVSLAAAASRHEDAEGALIAAAFETRSRGLTLSAQAQRSFGAYRDLAAVTSGERWMWRGRPVDSAPKSLVQLTASGPLNLKVLARSGDPPMASLTFAATEDASAGRRTLATASLRWSLGRSTAIQAAAFVARSDRRETGAFLSLTTTLGETRMASAGVDRTGERTAAYAEIRQQERMEPGATAWRVQVSKGEEAAVDAEAVYRSRVGRLAGRVSGGRGGVRAEGRIDGAIVWMRGPLLAPQWVDGAFAVVDVGAPGVGVRQQNRPIGRSGPRGRLLALNLNAYEANALAIDLDEISIDLAAATARQVVTPAYGGGVLVRFGVAATPVQAMVSLRFADGTSPPAGARAALNGGPADLIVGYDGATFVLAPAAENLLLVNLGGGERCTARFAVDLSAKGRLDVGTAVCR